MTKKQGFQTDFLISKKPDSSPLKEKSLILVDATKKLKKIKKAEKIKRQRGF